MKFKYNNILMNKKIIYNKNKNMVGKRYLERNKQVYNEIHKNNVSYIERPQYSQKCDSNLNINFSRYMMGGKASLGYNNFKEENNTNQFNKNFDEQSIKKNRIDLNDSILPPNIYHNFSESTRLKRNHINYDINIRNTYTH